MSQFQLSIHNWMLGIQPIQLDQVLVRWEGMWRGSFFCVIQRALRCFRFWDVSRVSWAKDSFHSFCPRRRNVNGLISDYDAIVL